MTEHELVRESLALCDAEATAALDELLAAIERIEALPKLLPTERETDAKEQALALMREVFVRMYRVQFAAQRART